MPVDRLLRFTPAVSPAVVHALWAPTGTKEREEDTILVDGIVRYCEDLQVDPTDVRVLILAHYLNAERMCEFTRASFVQGWIQLGGDTIKKQREIVRDLDKELDDPEALRDVYQFAFNFGRGENQKSLRMSRWLEGWPHRSCLREPFGYHVLVDPSTFGTYEALDVAVAYWQLLLKGRFKHLDLWLQFVQEEYGKSISRDTWNLVSGSLRVWHVLLRKRNPTRGCFYGQRRGFSLQPLSAISPFPIVK